MRNRIGLGLSTKILASFVVTTLFAVSLLSFMVLSVVKDRTYLFEKEKATILLDSVSSEVGMSLFLGMTGESTQKVKELLGYPEVLSVRIDLASGATLGRFDRSSTESQELEEAIRITKEVTDSINGKKLATIELYYSNHNYLKLIQNFEQMTIKFVLIAIFIFVLNLLFVKHLLSPLTQIATKMREYSPGHQVSFDIVENDNEIGTIVTSFKAMQANIDNYSCELQKKEQELFHQAKLKALTDMISAIAHHWRQPINALGLVIQDILYALEADEIDKAYIERYQNDSMKIIQSMSKTIDDFTLFFASSDKTEDFGVVKLVEDVYTAFEKQLSSAGINTHIRGEDFEISGQRELLREVFINIVNNSKFAIEQKRESSQSFMGKISILIDKEKKEIVFTDNGGGIREDILVRIFEPYFTTKQQGDGVGLGLFMSKTVVSNMGGSISAQNHEDGLRLVVSFKGLQS